MTSEREREKKLDVKTAGGKRQRQTDMSVNLRWNAGTVSDCMGDCSGTTASAAGSLAPPLVLLSCCSVIQPSVLLWLFKQSKGKENRKTE